MHLSIILGNDQLDIQLFIYNLFIMFLYMFRAFVLIIRSLNFIDAAFGIVPLTKRLSGSHVERERRDLAALCIFRTMQMQMVWHIWKWAFVSCYWRYQILRRF